ncbi:MAG: hypothetical protein AAF383_26650 [Cyanobacteria bacterium P01_A01_bin.83]
MVDWSSLRDVGGSAEYLPALLEELETSRDPKILDILWKRLCHQGSVFSASFAALPHLVRIAEQWSSSERISIIHLAVSILSGEDIANLRRPGEDHTEWTPTGTRIDLESPTRSNYQKEIDTLLRLIEDDLQQPNLSTYDFSWLLSFMLPLKGYSQWQDVFDYFKSSMCGYYGCCRNCDAEIEIYGYDAIAELIETSNGQRQQTTLQPMPPELLTGIVKWLYETAKSRGYDSVAQKVTHMLATGSCPKCGTRFQVPELLGFADIVPK